MDFISRLKTTMRTIGKAKITIEIRMLRIFLRVSVFIDFFIIAFGEIKGEIGI